MDLMFQLKKEKNQQLLLAEILELKAYILLVDFELLK
jgi:hypothetical protein